MAGVTYTERTVAVGTFQEGIRNNYDATTDYFIDPLFEGTAFVGLVAQTYAERTVSASTLTKRTVPNSAWGERSVS